MEELTVALFGHREIDDIRSLEDRLYPLAEEIIRNSSYTTFLIGRNGEFDICAASVIKRVQRRTGNENSELICVFPYLRRDMEYYEKYYDGILLPECTEKAHYKSAITKRNQWMVERADLIICYVERSDGGAYAALRYARVLKKKLINLTEKQAEDE